MDNYQKVKSGLWWTEEKIRVYQYWSEIISDYEDADITLDQLWRHVEENPDMDYTWKNSDYYLLPDRIHDTLSGWNFELINDSNLTYYNARDFDNDEIALFYGTETWRHKEMPHNLQVIQSILTEGELHYWLGRGGFTSEDFMMAVSKWPAFCGETWNGADLVETCRRELTLFFTWMRFDDTYKPWGEYRDYQAHTCDRRNGEWSCNGDCELAGWENVEMICSRSDGTIYDGTIDTGFNDDGELTYASYFGVGYTCTDKAGEVPELICFEPPVECYDISDNSEMGCYSDKDFVQFDWSYIADD